MRTRTALAGAVLTAGAIFGITGGTEGLAEPCGSDMCLQHGEPSLHECGGNDCLAYPCTGADCARPDEPTLLGRSRGLS